MSFPRYRQYAEKKVADLPPLPQHWQPSLLKRWITVRSGDMISSSEETQEGFPLIGGNGIRAYTNKKNTLANTLIIGRVGAKCGCIHYIEEDFWASEHAFRVIEKRLLSKRFFFHLLTALNLNQFAIKTAQPLLNTEIVETQWIGTPPIDEQELIGKFLDHETAKIDALIAEQERLIELLQEKRQAVISHAVIKGLNPNTPMKDSGMEWLGEVPEHWSIKKLKYVATLIDGDRSSEYPSGDEITEEGVPFLSSKNIKDFEFTADGMQFISQRKFDTLSRGKIKDGDLAITVRGTIGHVALFRESSVGANAGFINAQLMIIRLNKLEPKFLLFVTQSEAWRRQVNLASYGTAQQQLSQKVLSEIEIAIPHEDEIGDICVYLAKSETAYKKLLDKSTCLINLLKERRSALISAAVTGQIDVRGLVSEEVAA